MIIEHEEFGIGEIMAGSERLDESTGILYADVLFEDDVKFDMAIGVMSEGMRKYPGGLRKSPNFYGNDSTKDKLIKDKFDEIEKNFGKGKQQKANEEAEVNEIFDNTPKGGANASKYLNARTSAKGRHISQEPEKKQALVYRTIKKAQRRNDLSSVNKKLADTLTREEVEQIDEIGDTTAGRKVLASYLKKSEDETKPEKKLEYSNPKKWLNRVMGQAEVNSKLANEEVEQIDELSKEKLSSYVKAKKAAIPYKAKDKEIEKAEKKIKKMNENTEPKVSGYTEMSRMKAVESVARSIMSQNRDLRQEALISDFNSRNHQANNNKGE